MNKKLLVIFVLIVLVSTFAVGATDWVRPITVTNVSIPDSYWNRTGVTVRQSDSTNTLWLGNEGFAIGDNYIPPYILQGSPTDSIGLRMTQRFINPGSSSGISMFINHAPNKTQAGVYSAIGGFNIVEGENFSSGNEITALNFGNYEYFTGVSGSNDTDWLAVDVFGMNEVDGARSRDVYGYRAIPIIKGRASRDAYGYYYSASTNADITGNEYGVFLEKPTLGDTANYQLYLDSTGAGSGIFFDDDARIYSDATNLQFTDAASYAFDDDVEITGYTNIGDGGTTNYCEIKTDGELNLHGTARVLKKVQIPVNAAKAPGSSPATYIQYGLGGAWEFSKSTTNQISATMALQLDIDKSVAPKLQVGWTSDVNSGDAKWQLEILYRQGGELWNAAADSTTTGIETVPGTAHALTVKEWDLPMLHADDAGILIKISRLGGDVDDDADGVVNLVGMSLIYTANKLGTAT